jgi:hypothetical protein
MIRWFFLAVLISVASLGNVIAYQTDVNLGSKLFAFIAVNIFVLSLLALWVGGYERRFREKGLLIVGHATLMLAVGVALIGWGYHGLRVEDCGFLVRNTRLLSDLAVWAIDHRVCGWLSIALVGFGVWFLWPSARLFYRLTRDMAGTRET